MERPAPQNSKELPPVNLDIPVELETKLTNAADQFSVLVEDFVKKNVKCFLEKVYTTQEHYLTFVCAQNGIKNIRDLLKQEFTNDLVCQKIDCNTLQNDLMDKMLDHNNKGLSQEGVQVTSKSFKTTLKKEESEVKK